MSPCRISLLSTLPFASMPALWGNAKHYIAFTCPKYLVICVANALLATGWLVLVSTTASAVAFMTNHTMRTERPVDMQ